MTAPFEISTPGGHFTIRARGWTTEERPQVLAELRPMIDALRMAFPELDNGATLAGLANLSSIIAEVFTVPDTEEPEESPTAYAELTADDLR
ncbi:hypothetical protein [Nocardia gipuzkoensis]|uniref:hypothetical protein n=1 Tax=Nocardia gipuzkoensis TaxID=2749991 RepID=UPI00237D4DCA|nr:hypothetical protein [Nocardia gipuzkoensis]MDE1673756.1 hypothetical protein [Nocardia gipuzkoensis]